MASTGIVGQSVMESILSTTDFEVFASAASTAPRGGMGGGTGLLEGTPHNAIHGFVGGTMGTFDSPLDPIFWTHHNMIDCCWANWNIDRNNPNTNNTTWTQYTFTNNFVDETGSAVSPVSGVSVLLPLLTYQFEDSVKGDESPRFAIREAKRTKKMLEEGTDVRLETVERYAVQRGAEVVLNQPLSQSIPVDASVFRSFLETNRDFRLLLRIGGVMPSQEEDFFVRVFVNNASASGATPLDDPSYAGSFSFFSDERHAHGDDGLTYVVDLTDSIRALHRMDRVNTFDAVDIQLVAVPMSDLPQRGDRFNLGSLELNVSRFTSESENS